MLALIKTAKKKACLVRVCGAPRLSCGEVGGWVGLAHGDTRVQLTQTHTHTHTQIREQRCFQVTQNVRQEQSMCEEGGGTPGRTQVMEGEKGGGIAQGDITLVWPVSRPPVLEHEKEQVVYTLVKKSLHIHLSTWMLFRLMDSELTQ